MYLVSIYFDRKNDQSNAGIHHSGCKKKRKSIYDREKCTSAFDDFCI